MIFNPFNVYPCTYILFFHFMLEIFPRQRGACGIGFEPHTRVGCVIAEPRRLLLRVLVESW